MPDSSSADSPAGARNEQLDRKALAEIVELALWAGQLAMENGAETQRVEHSVRSVGRGLGCDWGNVLVTHGAIIVTYVGGTDFRTKVRSVRVGGVNMSAIEAMSHLCHQIERGEHDRASARAALALIERAPRHYREWQTALAAGLGCAAFCRLFGGGWLSLLITFVASSSAMLLRHWGIRRGHNPLVVAGAVAFLAALLVGLAQRVLAPAHEPEPALAASVLMLVPGVPTINAIEDLIKGHVVTGISRASWALLIVAAATVGLLAAVHILGHLS